MFEVAVVWKQRVSGRSIEEGDTHTEPHRRPQPMFLDWANAWAVFESIGAARANT